MHNFVAELLVSQLVLLGVSLALGVVAGEFLRHEKSSGSGMLEFPLSVMMAWGSFWLFCLIASLVVLALDLSILGGLKALILLLSGFFLGTSLVFLIPFLWASWRDQRPD